MQLRRWAVLPAAAALLLLGACGGEKQESGAAAATDGAAATAAGTAQPTGTPTPAALDFTRMEKYIPTDDELPDRVSYQAKFDLSNEKAAKEPTQLQQFRDTGRITGIQFIFSVEAGARTVSIGISYYNNTAEPRKLLRASGDPAAVTAPGRFQVPGLGDEYIATRGQLGSGEGALQLLNLAWVRGPFFVSLADFGGPPDKPADIAIALARTIDEKLKTDPMP